MVVLAADMALHKSASITPLFRLAHRHLFLYLGLLFVWRFPGSFGSKQVDKITGDAMAFVRCAFHSNVLNAYELDLLGIFRSIFENIMAME
jgi:hypothetical protein